MLVRWHRRSLSHWSNWHLWRRLEAWWWALRERLTSWTEIPWRWRSVWHSIETRTWWEITRWRSVAATILLCRIVAAELRWWGITMFWKGRLATVLRLLRTLSRTRGLSRTRRVLQRRCVSLLSRTSFSCVKGIVAVIRRKATEISTAVCAFGTGL